MGTGRARSSEVKRELGSMVVAEAGETAHTAAFALREASRFRLFRSDMAGAGFNESAGRVLAWSNAGALDGFSATSKEGD